MVIERTRLPGQPEQSLAVTEIEFIQASEVLWGSGKAGQFAYRGLKRFIGYRPENPEYAIEVVDGEPAIPPSAVQAVLERPHTRGIGERSRAVIELIHQDILIRSEP